MLYLLDANVLITASRLYYPIDQVPEFWSWLLHQATSGFVKIPLEIIEEVRGGRRDNDLLMDWISQDENADALLLEEAVDAVLVQRVVATGYAADLTDDEVEKIGRDPFLIAYALSNPADVGLLRLKYRDRRRSDKTEKSLTCAGLSASNVVVHLISTANLVFVRAGELPARINASRNLSVVPVLDEERPSCRAASTRL
jgi:hypothetical protein